MNQENDITQKPFKVYYYCYIYKNKYSRKTEFVRSREYTNIGSAKANAPLLREDRHQIVLKVWIEEVILNPKVLKRYNLEIYDYKYEIKKKWVDMGETTIMN